jgi:CheY-like chemotaxis protein
VARTQKDERSRNRQTAARQSRKLGYEVIECPSGDQLPPFLRGFSPDLIATSDDDHVVLEIKRAADPKGSNEIKELAAAVDRRGGWRFELIALGPNPPDVVVPSETALDRLTERALALYDSGWPDTALLYAASVLEELIRDAGAQHRIKGKLHATQVIVSDLVFRGVVGEEVADALDRAWERRSRIVHGSTSDQHLDRAAIVEVIAACREVQAEMRLQAA